MKYILILCTYFIFLISQSFAGIIEDIYLYTKKGTREEMLTAFILLSKMALGQKEFEMMEKDYKKEKDSERRYLYEFVFASRMMGPEYKRLFIKHSIDHKNLLIGSSANSLYVSVNSPIYYQLEYYTPDDQALKVLLEISKIADGVDAEAVSSDLFDIYKLFPEKIKRIAKEINFDLKNYLRVNGYYAYHAWHNNEDLKILLKQTQTADKEDKKVIIQSVLEIYQNNPERVKKVSKEMNFDLKQFLKKYSN